MSRQAEPSRGGDARRFERRAGPRVAFTARVNVVRENEKLLMGATLDLGLGGMCLLLSEPIEVKAIRRVEISLGRSTLEVDAQGMWQRPDPTGFVVGVQFLRVGAAESSTLWRSLQLRALDLSRFIVETSALSPIDVDVAMDITLRTRRREFQPGHAIYRAGDGESSEESILVLMSGSVLLEIPMRDAPPLEIERVEVGGVFGGVPLLLGVPHVESATAIDAVQALEIDRYSLWDLCAEKPLAGRTLERAVLRRYPRVVTELAPRIASAGAPSETA